MPVSTEMLFPSKWFNKSTDFIILCNCFICASVLRNTSIKLMEDDVILYFSIGDLKHLTSYKKIVRSFARKLQQRQLEQVVDLFWVWSDEKNGSRNGEQLRVHPRAISTSTELSRLL